MPYPERYFPGHNFTRDEQLGQETRAPKLDGEFARLAHVTNQLNTFLRQFTTADGKLNLPQAVLRNDVIDVQEETGDGIQTRFLFDQPIDAAVDLVRAWVDGVRVDPAGYDDEGIDFAVAPVGEIELRIYFNLAGVLNRIQSIVADEGASYIGYDNPEGTYTAADNVRDALTEVRRELEALITALDDLGGYLVRNGTLTLRGNWDVNETADDTDPPVLAEGSFTILTTIADGDTVELNDGFYTRVFEFTNMAPADPDNIVIPIDISPIPDPLEVTAANAVAAISGSVIGFTPVAVLDGSDYRIDLTAQVPSDATNNPIVLTGTGLGSAVGMAGGTAGTIHPLATQFRLRRHPVSLQDGDVVVHQQLRAILQEAGLLVGNALRTDGGNSMQAHLNHGGFQSTEMADGTEADHGATVGQADIAIAAAVSDLADVTLNRVDPGEPGMERDLHMSVETDDSADPPSEPRYAVKHLVDPVDNRDAAHKKYVDGADLVLQDQIDAIESEIASVESEVFDHFLGVPLLNVIEDPPYVEYEVPASTDVWGIGKICTISGTNNIGYIGTHQVNPSAFVWTIEARVRCVSWTNSDGRASFGAINPVIDNGRPRGIYFYSIPGTYDNWAVVQRPTGAPTLIHATAIPANDWAVLKIVRTGDAEMEFYVNDVLEYTINASDLATMILGMGNWTTDYFFALAGGTDGIATVGQGVDVDWMRIRQGGA